MSHPATVYPFNTPSTSPASIADQQAIEYAIHAQLVLASALPPGRIIWEGQSRDRPGTTPATRDLITLAWGDPVADAPATPEERTDNTAGAPAGEEVTITTIDQDRVSLVVNYYAGKHTGNVSARSKLKAIRNYLNRATVIDALMVSAIALIEPGTVQSLPAVLETEYESRARMVMVLGLADGTTEKVTNIETAEWTADLDT